MMNFRLLGALTVASLVAMSAAHAAGGCKLVVFAELPVTMEGPRPIVMAKINGVDTRFVLDSGAYQSMLTPAMVAQLKLPTRFARTGAFIQGIGGSIVPRFATVQTFTLGTYPVHNLLFMVGGNDLGIEVAGLFGQNLMRVADVEFDFANGVLRFVKPQNCSGPLAYWNKSGPFGAVDIDEPTPYAPSPTGEAFVNGVKVRVKFDTGSSSSVLSLAAAKRAGITPGSPGVKPLGDLSGIGDRVESSWIAPVTSFKIGGEEIQHTKVMIGDFDLTDTDMLIGADFFLSHRVFVAYDQRKVYFTYNGGPVFDLQSPRRAKSEPPTPLAQSAASTATPDSGATPAASSSPSSAAAPLPTDGPGNLLDQPADAAGFMRRGAAYAARRDFDKAIPDLKRACELAPRDPENFLELGHVERQSGNPDLAMAAFDKALELKPDYVAALFARTQLRRQQRADVTMDLDTLDRVLTPEDSLRLDLGEMYDDNRQFTAAVHQFDVWIGARKADVRLEIALNGRCWARAEANQDLDRALADCEAALRLQPKDPDVLDSRGFVQLRRGDLDRSIADYDAAIALRPKTAASLYGRGLAKLRKGLQTQGQADLDAANAIDQHIAARFAGFGLKP